MKVVRDLGDKNSKPQIQPSSIRLTERNLTQYFNPDYTDVADELVERPHPYMPKDTVSKWIAALP